MANLYSSKVLPSLWNEAFIKKSGTGTGVDPEQNMGGGGGGSMLNLGFNYNTETSSPCRPAVDECFWPMCL